MELSGLLLRTMTFGLGFAFGVGLFALNFSSFISDLDNEAVLLPDEIGGEHKLVHKGLRFTKRAFLDILASLY